MSEPRDSQRPMAEPGPKRDGADVGGIAKSADGGMSDALQRQSERRDETARSGAVAGEGSRAAPGRGAVPAGTGARPAPAAEPGSGTSTSSATRASSSPEDARKSAARPAGTGFDDEEKEDGPWRHDPVAPNDESPLDSLGRSVSEVVTGPLDGADGKPKR